MLVLPWIWVPPLMAPVVFLAVLPSPTATADTFLFSALMLVLPWIWTPWAFGEYIPPFGPAWEAHAGFVGGGVVLADSDGSRVLLAGLDVGVALDLGAALDGAGGVLGDVAFAHGHGRHVLVLGVDVGVALDLHALRVAGALGLLGESRDSDDSGSDENRDQTHEVPPINNDQSKHKSWPNQPVTTLKTTRRFFGSRGSRFFIVSVWPLPTGTRRLRSTPFLSAM
ncbi:MAG: hypothetical protein H6R10_1812 [Rhodocyclaceae bacterium]|nr:hypothetical protein [Rhodocyclaceae bacterium]